MTLKCIAYLCLPCNYIGPGLYSFRKKKNFAFSQPRQGRQCYGEIKDDPSS